MKIFMCMLIVFILAGSKVDSGDECAIHAFVPVIKMITEWIHRNGFSNKFHSGPTCRNHDGKVYGECLAGFFGEKPPRCRLDLAIGSLLPKCDIVFENTKFHQIISESRKNVNLVFTQFTFFLDKYTDDSDDFCNSMESYIKARINAAEDGHFDKSKMKKYCGNNQDICSDWNEVLKIKFSLLKDGLALLPFWLGKNELTNENILNKSIEFSIKATIPEDVWAQDNLTPCIQEFFEIVSKHLF